MASMAYDLAASRDADAMVPGTEISALADYALLHAPLPEDLGGQSLGMSARSALALRDVLRTIGGASLSLGRLWIARAATGAESPDRDPADAAALVNLARCDACCSARMLLA
ncbi:hypothetical protein [Hyphomonas sp.]|uniref:hypothetical protein n=1 Tax=Hyphomonas sp. TaxID=87 RepID=UPI00391A1439